MTAGEQGYRYTLTVIDHYSRYTKFYPLKEKKSAKIITCLASFIADFGQPRALVLDNGGEFTSQAFRAYCEKLGIACHYCTPYHPQGNAITERQHRNLKGVLSTLCKGHPLRWPRLLPLPGTCRKLNVRWLGPYLVQQVLRDGGAYVLSHTFSGQVIQRAADKVKMFISDGGEWVIEPQECQEPDPVPEEIPERIRRPPRRLIEEM